MICDWKESVIQVKPTCGITPLVPEDKVLPPVLTTTKPFATTIKKPSNRTRTLPVKPPYLSICDPTIPNVEHPHSCIKFLQCVQSKNGSFYYEEKSCSGGTMFNPVKNPI